MSDISVRIRQAREKKGWSMLRLAREAGVSSGYLPQVGVTIREPRIQTIQKLSGALGVSFEWLAFGKGKKA